MKGSYEVSVDRMGRLRVRPAAADPVPMIEVINYVRKTHQPILCSNDHAGFAPLQSIYVTMFPCNSCAKLLIQAGIREVIYFEVSL